MTLDEMEARAQRQLDGLTVNRDAMARDVLLLVRSIRAMQTRAADTGGKPFASAFEDVLGDIFGRKQG